MEYTKEQIEQMRIKADKWDALGTEIAKFYLNTDGEYDKDNPEKEGDLTDIGECAAAAFGWL